MNIMRRATQIISMSETSNEAAQAADSPWPLLPTETEIYILPSGQVVFADLPAELAALATDLGTEAPPVQPLPPFSSSKES